ncbi:ABC transporter G family member 14 [Striga hermonthica]|uniref:ABC transporter G family member 14 n=1 Tax=Striga hermonthica TaxID=68872 RepID=A0A9N7NWD9_STRHE|nr:ABC transporter G family member 14 [Striga hermonthica]
MPLMLAVRQPDDDARELGRAPDDFLPNSKSYQHPVSYPITLKFESIVYKVNLKTSIESTKTILDGVSGLVGPGELLAMLGPSGSGKTTLLTALGGRRLTGSLSGRVIYNRLPFSGRVRRRTGFVAQDDVLYPNLTVFETLLFTALLRLPESLTRAEKARHVEEVVLVLGLSGCADGLVGGPFLRGISGGERKRVSIGQEMLVNPSLLLLDEPTSGLDSTGAYQIVGTLRELARAGGRTVITTIHQPSSRVYYMFDKVLVLSMGRPVYYGPGPNAMEYFESIGLSPSVSVNPADFMLDLANGLRPESQHAPEVGDGSEKDPTESLRDFLVTCYKRNIGERLKVELRGSGSGSGADFDTDEYPSDDPASLPEKWCTSWWHQFKILLVRGLHERRFEAVNKLRVFQVLSVAILGGLLWWRTPPSKIDEQVSLMFFFSVFWGFYPLYNAVFTYPQERAMLVKERSSGMYRLSAYFAARAVSDLPMDLALPTAFTCILYWMGGLKSDPRAFILSLLVVLFGVLVAQSLGLAFGALLMDVKQAATLASVTTVVFSVAGGYYVRKIPIFIVWLKYASFSYYFYKLLLGIQYDEDDYYECGAGKGECRVWEHPAIKSIGLRYLWVDVTAMVVMLVVYRLAAYLGLRRVK